MKKMKLIRYILILFVLFALFSCSSRSDSLSPSVGGTAPGFTLKDINGRTVSLNDLKGKVVLLEFWATWCPPCRKSIPEIEALNRKFFNKDVVLLGINVEGDEALDNVKNFVNQYNMSYTVLVDNGEASKKYQVSSIPALYLIDKNQRIVKRYIGFSPGLGEELSRQIEALL